ncbi:MAG: TIGR04283 family arsenosugar biosynthesis glycosyltransferase [Alphaproteobacteria bacterium]
MMPVPTLGIVVPVLNSADRVRRLLPTLNSDLLDIDIIVADGGSTDQTVDVASRFGARIAHADGGRGPQLRTGAETALGDWIFLLHADSVLPDGWDRLIAGFIADPVNVRRAGYFRFALDDAANAARRLEAMVAWRCRVLGLPYGDQGLVISRRFLTELGGVPDLPLMEDVSLVRRVGKGRLIPIEAPLVTSADKFRRGGYLIRSARNLFCLMLYLFGVPPRVIVAIYR